MGNNDIIDFKNLVFEISQKNLEYQRQRYKDMDTKAISIITITGILISFLVGSGSLINSNTISSSGSCISQILYGLTALSFLLTVLLSVWVIKVRYVKMFDTNCVLTNLKVKKINESQIMENINSFYLEAESDLFKVCNEKGEKLTYSVYFLGVSVFLLISYSISIFR